MTDYSDICERAAEVEDALYCAWLKENRHSLKEYFIEDHEDEFNEFCRESYREFGRD